MDLTLLKNAQDSKLQMLMLPSTVKNHILTVMSKAILENIDFIIQENQKDIQLAKANNLDYLSLERLYLNEASIYNMSKTLLNISKLEEPLGKVLKSWKNKDNLEIKQISAPIGVIAIIYESRPNVTSDVAALCFKSGNICILKGGKEAKYSNQAIVNILQNVLEKNSLPKEIISFLPSATKETVGQLIKENNFIDLILPRGGRGLIKYILENSSVPVIEQGRGLCHVYIHTEADISKALEISLNSKCQHPSVCNAMETLLIDKNIANHLLPKIYKNFIEASTLLKGCKKVQEIIDVADATHKDFDTEYLANTLNIKIVENIEEAIKHIDTYGSRHSESIITENTLIAEQFMNQVDAACLYVNASTKFTDGETFGFGSEVGISTSKLHVRGPIGINELTTYKYKVYGENHIKVSWQGSFGYQGLFSIIIIGSILNFIPISLVMLPLGYFSSLYSIPLIVPILLGIAILFLKKESNLTIIKKIFLKYPNFSNYINQNITGLEQFVSLPSALSKIPPRGLILFKLLNTSFWVILLVSLGSYLSS